PSSLSSSCSPLHLHSFPTRRSSDLSVPIEVAHRSAPTEAALIQDVAGHGSVGECARTLCVDLAVVHPQQAALSLQLFMHIRYVRSEEHTSELQSRVDLVCRLLLEKK